MNTKISKKMDSTDNNSKNYENNLASSSASAFETKVSSLGEEISMLQLGDSFFPTGMYTTSSGLETLFYDKRIKSKKEIFEFITVCLTYQIGPADCAALSNAY
jgi:urease accessory protein